MISAVSLAAAAGQSMIDGMARQSAAKAGGAGFAEMLIDAGRSAAAKLQNAESVSMQSLKGEFDPRVVADAVMGAEQTLQTAIVIRDKIVTAYLEISRMAI